MTHAEQTRATVPARVVTVRKGETLTIADGDHWDKVWALPGSTVVQNGPNATIGELRVVGSLEEVTLRLYATET